MAICHHLPDFARSSLRPSTLPEMIAAGSFMNLTMTIALYAAICKEQGLPFRWAFMSGKAGL